MKEALDKKELSVNQGYQITRQVQDLPEDEQGQAALDLVELEKAKKEIREKDAEIDRQSKIAGVFCKAYEKAVLLTPTEENVRIWVKCTRMTREEMEDTIRSPVNWPACLPPLPASWNTSCRRGGRYE